MSLSSMIMFSKPKFWYSFFVSVVILAQLVLGIIFTGTFSDEAEFAYKGLLAVTGQAEMYQNDGVWYSYMPWAYLIPGHLQHWLGSSLWVGRIFSSACATLMLLLVYLGARNLSVRRAGLISVVLIAMCLVALRFYSLATTEALTALLVVASFYFLTTRISSPLKELLSVLLSIGAFMVRQNMLYALVMILFYCVVSQRSIKRAVSIMLLASLALTIMIRPFWPGICHDVLRNMPLLDSGIANMQRRGLAVTTCYDASVSVNPAHINSNSVNISLDFSGQWEPPREQYPVLKSENRFVCMIGSIMLLFQENYVWRAVYKNMSFYLPVLLPFLAGLVVLLFELKKGWAYVIIPARDRLLLFMALYFVINAAGHWYYSKWFFYGNVVRYICYFLPVAAIFSGVCLDRFIGQNAARKSAVVSGLVVLFIAQLASGSFHYKMGIPVQPGIHNMASKLKAHTSPTDKIFAISDMHIFLMAERRPYDQLMNNQWSFVADDVPADLMRKTHFWNYNLADRFLEEADVAVISTESFGYLKELFKGKEKSGLATHEMIQRKLDELYDLVEEVSWYYDGNLRIYRKKAAHADLK